MKLADFEGHKGSVEALDFSQDGTMLASASKDKTVRVWDVKLSKQITKIEHKQWTRAVSFSRDGKRLASASGPGEAKIPGTVKMWICV